MMRIGVVGDIHGNYTALQNAVRQMGKIDHLWFTGDGVREIRLLAEATGLFVRGVRGNCDFTTSYPDEELFNLENHTIWLTHGHLYGVKSSLTRLSLAGAEKGAQLIVYGHTHLPEMTEWHGIIIFNPGTLCRERAYHEASYGIIEISDTGVHPSLYRL